MLCEECHKEPASVHVTQIINDHKTEMYLCNRCAREKGGTVSPMEPGFAFHNIIAGLFDPESSPAGSGSLRSLSTRCPGCGHTLADLRRVGQLGCATCYSEFERELEPLLRRIHRSAEHVGKVPRFAQDEIHTIRRKLDQLRSRLSAAVAKEAYEEAAKIRDEIRELEVRLSGQSSK